MLASQSPRRAELLRQAGISFEVRVANIDENRMPGESPADYVRRLALAKARAVARDGETVLGADTVVVAGGAVLGKPADAAEARRMLELLSGRAHQVLTGIAIVRDGQTIADCASTSVWFSPLRPEEIDAYVASGEPMDKAGGYAIQGLACRFVERIEGCYFNVVGLPVSLVYRHLAM